MWKDKLNAFASNRTAQLAVVGVLSGAGGTLASYKVTAQRLEKKYQLIADSEIASVKEHYSILRKDGENGDLAALAAPYHANDRIIREEGYVPADDAPASMDDIAAALERAESTPEADAEAEDEPEPTGSVTRTNVFQSDDPGTYWDWDEENERRESSSIFVITKDEFDAGERDFNTTTLTYFDEDGVLVDEKSQQADVNDVVGGEENMLRFGHASQDSNIVYIRNENLELDIEVIKSDGSYAKQVLGFIEHSDNRRARRFRHDD